MFGKLTVAKHWDIPKNDMPSPYTGVWNSRLSSLWKSRLLWLLDFETEHYNWQSTFLHFCQDFIKMTLWRGLEIHSLDPSYIKQWKSTSFLASPLESRVCFRLHYTSQTLFKAGKSGSCWLMIMIESIYVFTCWYKHLNILNAMVKYEARKSYFFWLFFWGGGEALTF